MMKKRHGLRTAWFTLHKSDVDPLSVVTRVFRFHFLRDRFGKLNKYSPFNVSAATDEIPEKTSVCPSFGYLLDKRATELLAKHEQIAVAWSGGVDSTSVVTALLRNLSASDYSRIKVIGTDLSVSEAPVFYNLLRKMGVDVTITPELIEDLGDVECDAIVSGWCADQLFGSDVHLKNLALYNTPWIDALDWHIKERTGMRLSQKSKDALVAIYSEYAQALGLSVEQWCEFAWMFNFGVKYSYIRDHSKLCLAGSPNADKVFPFFDTEDFQQYAISHFDGVRDENIYAKPSAYKRVIKEYIYDFDGDKTYLNTKGKVGSWVSGASSCYVSGAFPVLTDSGVTLFTKDNAPKACGSCRAKLKAAVAAMFRK